MAGPRRARTDSGGWRHIGRVCDGVVHKTARRIIAFQLERAAAGSEGHEVVDAFKKADGIRRRLRLSWERLICRRPGDGNGNAPR